MNKKLLLVLAIVLIGFIFYLNNEQSASVDPTPAEEPDSLRQLSQGSVVGFADEGNTHAWLGIPFAQAPVGDLRWKAPRPPQPWQGTLKALTMPQKCTQLWSDVTGDAGEQGDVVGGEDCLYLNIWAPKLSAGQLSESKLPVMFWIHGGGNTWGTINDYYGHNLADSQNVILVAANYRLGLLGWFRHEALRQYRPLIDSQLNALDASGNYGNLDHIAALKWIQNNIHAFGGNADNVTIFGESAGGRNVYSLIASPIAKGLFHKAIIQSGSVRTDKVARTERFSDDDAETKLSSNDIIAGIIQHDANLNISSRAEAKAYIQQLSTEQLGTYLYGLPGKSLLRHIASLDMGMYSALQNFNDGIVIPSKPLLDVFADASSYTPIPIVTGANRDEQKLFLLSNPEFVNYWFGTIPRVKNQEFYDRVSYYFSKVWKALTVDEPAKVLSAYQPVYTYRFDWDDAPQSWLIDYKQLVGAAHAVELAFVFGTFNKGVAIEPLYSDKNEFERVALSKAMMEHWGQFARTGNPSLPNQPWVQWRNDNPNMMVFDSESDKGIRMETSADFIRAIKTELANDSIFTQEEQCRMYKGLFLKSYQTSTFGDEAEYKNWGGGCD